MGQEIITYSKVLTHPVIIEFTCEHCGENNVFTQEIVGAGKKSKYRGDFDTKRSTQLTAQDQSKMLTKAQKDLDRGISNAKRNIEKNNFHGYTRINAPNASIINLGRQVRSGKAFSRIFLADPLSCFS